MKVELLDATHEDYDGDHLSRLRALYEGGRAWHEIKASIHPKRPVEPDDVYKERSSLLTYTNHAGGVVEMLAALLFAEAPAISGLSEGGRSAVYYQGLQQDADLSGTPWERWWRERVVDALVGRRAYAWVNLPARHEGTEPGSLADEQAGGLLDAYLVRLLPEQVRHWADDARGRLARVMVRDCVREWLGPDTGTATIWRWRYIDAGVIRTWEWKATEGKDAPDPKDDATELTPINHRLGRMPIVRLTLPPGLWAMGKLEDPAVRADRARNDHSWALHQAANELLTLTSKWGDERVELGHGHYLRLNRDQHGEDRAAYIAPSGVAFQYLQQDVADTREEVYRLVQQMALAADSDAARAPKSGESKKEDWHAVEIILAALADPVLGAMTETLRLIAAARGDTIEPMVTGLDGWQTENTEAFLESALVTQPLVKSPTYRRTIAKRAVERILGDEVDAETLDVIRKEIDAADYDEAPTFAPPPMLGRPKPPEDEDEEDEDEDVKSGGADEE